MMNKKKWVMIPLLIGIIAILAICMVGSVSAATYSISTSNSTDSINGFFSDEDNYYDPSIDDWTYSPLANGDTVIFNAGTYNVNLNVNKAITLKANGKVVLKGISINRNIQISGFLFNGNMIVNGNNNKITGNTFSTGNLILWGGKNTVTGNKLSKGNVIHMVPKKLNTVKNNKQIPYVDLQVKVTKITNKGIYVNVKNIGNKNSKATAIHMIYIPGTGDYYKSIAKVPALKKSKSKTVFIPNSKCNYKHIASYASSGETFRFKVDYRNKLKDIDTSNNGFVIQYSKNKVKVIRNQYA